jgi:hypothetical protein
MQFVQVKQGRKLQGRPVGFEKINSSAFQNPGIKAIRVQNNVENVKENCFRGCICLVQIPN